MLDLAHHQDLPSALAMAAAEKVGEAIDRGFRTVGVSIRGALLKCREGAGLVSVENMATHNLVYRSFTRKANNSPVLAMARAIDAASKEREQDFETMATLCLMECGQPPFPASIDDCVDYALEMMDNGPARGYPRLRFGFYLAGYAYGFESRDLWEFLNTGFQVDPCEPEGANIAEELQRLYCIKTHAHVWGGG